MLRGINDAAGRNIAVRSGQSIRKEALGNCLKNRKNQYYTTYSRIFKGMVISSMILLLVLCVFICLLPYIFNEPETNSDKKFKFIFISGCSAIILIELIFLRKQLFYKFTLTKKGLLIKKAFITKIVSYEEIYRNIIKWPPFYYKGSIILMSDNDVIEYEFTSLVGGLVLIKMLFNEINLPFENEEFYINKARTIMLKTATKEQKAEYKIRKEYIKNISL